MSEYIKREDVLECIEAMIEADKNSIDRYIYAKVIQQVKDMLVADAVELVRCKDCKNYMTIHCTCDGCCISDEWYCADGERKEREHE